MSIMGSNRSELPSGTLFLKSSQSNVPFTRVLDLISFTSFAFSFLPYDYFLRNNFNDDIHSLYYGDPGGFFVRFTKVPNKWILYLSAP